MHIAKLLPSHFISIVSRRLPAWLRSLCGHLLTRPKVVAYTLLLIVSGSLATPANAQSLGSPVRIDVNPTGGASYDRSQGSMASKATESKKLEIILSSSAREVPAGLKVRWTIYGRTMDGNRLTSLGTGESAVAVAPGQKQTVLSETITATSTPAHSVSSGSGRGRGRVKSKQMPAEGSRYAGYGVQILQGSTVVGENYSSQGLKEQASSLSR